MLGDLGLVYIFMDCIFSFAEVRTCPVYISQREEAGLAKSYCAGSNTINPFRQPGFSLMGSYIVHGLHTSTR